MNLPRYLRVIVFLAFAAGVMTCGSVSAQGGGKSLPELRAQAQKIKVGETTEAEVISLLGQPSKTFEESKPRAGARDFKEIKKLFYGPENNIVVIIDKSTGKVTKANIKPSR
jgi:hypothetical protein